MQRHSLFAAAIHTALSQVLLYGPPGTGKTMLVKAVANATTASFIRVVGSEFVQKYLGEGPRMVRDVFRLARENAPAIIFIDEIDAIATKRFDAQTGADREVQRILLELLNQMDGFDQGSNVKVSLARLAKRRCEADVLAGRSSWRRTAQTRWTRHCCGLVVSTGR